MVRKKGQQIPAKFFKQIANDYKSGIPYREILSKYKRYGANGYWIEQALKIYQVPLRRPPGCGVTDHTAQAEVDKANAAVETCQKADPREVAQALVSLLDQPGEVVSSVTIIVNEGGLIVRYTTRKVKEHVLA